MHGEVMKGKEVTKKARIDAEPLSYKEGLALINEATLTAVVAALAVYRANKLIKTAEIAAAMSLQASNCIVDAFEEVHRARPRSIEGFLKQDKGRT